MAVATLKRRALGWKAAACMALAMACAPLTFAAPAMPDSAVAADTFVVASVNLSKVDPDSVDATIKAVAGPAADAASAQMGEFRTKYKEMVDAGAEAALIAIGGDPAGEPTGSVYFKVKAGTDHAAAEAKYKEAVAAEVAKGGKPDEMDVSWEGDFMVLRKKGVAAPAADAGRAKLFADAFSSGDKALEVVMVPTDKLRAKMKEQAAGGATGAPPWVKDAGDAATDAKSMSLAITLGGTPTVDVVIEAADEAGGKKLAAAAAEGQTMMKGYADVLKGGGAETVPMGNALATLAGALNAKQDGAKVSLSIDAKTVGPAIVQLIPMAMGGGPGGAPAAPKP